MPRSAKPSIDSILADLAALKDSVAELAASGAADAANEVAGAARRAGSAAVEQTDQMLDSVRETVREKPLFSLLGAFALGVSMAGLLRR